MKSLTLSEKREFYSALLSLYGAGFSYTDAFSSIETSTGNKNIKILAKCFRVEVQNGVPFDKIAIKYKEMLGVPYALLLSAGDKSGKLDEILATILSDLKRLTGLRNGLIASLTYPVLMFFAALAVLLFCRFCFFKIFDVMYTAGMSPEAMMSLAVTAILKILLIYAEALNELSEGEVYHLKTYSNEDVEIKRDEDEMRYAIKRIRMRAGVPDYTNETYKNQADFRVKLKRERQVELLGENSMRYFDLRRWKDALTEENQLLQGCNINISDDDTYIADFYKETPVSSVHKVFEQRMYLFPFPTYELKRNVNLTQNPGW